MKKKLFVIIPLLLAIPLAIKVGSMAVKASQEDEPIHPNGNSDVTIDYHPVGDESIEPERPFDDSVKYNYSSYVFNVKHGGFNKAGSSYVSNASDSMTVCDDIPFPYGTFEVSMTGASTSADQGVVFSVTDSSKTSYWEGDGVSYYFFFLGRTGQLTLGKTTNGVWETRNEVSVGSVSSAATYKMKVVLKSNLMIFYFNDELKFYVKDNQFLEGTKWGLRAGASGTKYTMSQITNDYIVE